MNKVSIIDSLTQSDGVNMSANFWLFHMKDFVFVFVCLSVLLSGRGLAKKKGYVAYITASMLDCGLLQEGRIFHDSKKDVTLCCVSEPPESNSS